jgi:hypothetical protein
VSRKYVKPFPEEKPNYYTDDAGDIKWNYKDPCQTWENAKAMYEYNKSVLANQRSEIYQSLYRKLSQLYY